MGKTTIQPTVMSGSNSYGNWIKFANGIMIQYGASGPWTVNANSTREVERQLPLSFINTDYVIFTELYWTSIPAQRTISSGAKSLDRFKANFQNNNPSAFTEMFHFLAIGRWK